MDLAQEGRHLWQFNYNFRKQPHIRFPYPIYPLVSPEVTATFLLLFPLGNQHDMVARCVH